MILQQLMLHCTAQVGLIICCIVIASRHGERPVQQSLDLAARVGRELMRYENEGGLDVGRRSHYRHHYTNTAVLTLSQSCRDKCSAATLF